MHRFWIFPGVLGLFGAVIPTTALEGLIPLVTVILRSAGQVPPAFREVIDNLMGAIELGFAAGIVLGLLFAAFDFVYNRRKSRSVRQLVVNIAWCLLYAQLVLVVNMLGLFFVIWLNADELWQSPIFLRIMSLTLWLPPLLHFAAIVWGTIHTISTNDILSPRVLRSQLKRSATVEE